VDDPLPIDPVCKALGLQPTDILEAQVFQVAACNFRCWYCYVPYNLLGANIKYSGWLSPSELIDLYLDQENPPLVIDLSGGHPDLVPEWIPWMMKEIQSRGMEKRIYLWSDDNLSTEFIWNFLNKDDQQLILSYKYYSRVCCFKGFDNESFAFNTRADTMLFDRQFELMRKLLAIDIDIYAYVTFTSGTSIHIDNRMCKFIDRLQALDNNLPLRTVPLEIQIFSPVIERINPSMEMAIRNQYFAIEAWRKELEKRYTSAERSQNIAKVPLWGHNQK